MSKSLSEKQIKNVAGKLQSKPKKTRRRYPPEIKQAIIDLYPLCPSVEDKIELAEKLGIADLHKLYNLASRLGVTKEYDECFDPNGDWIYEGAHNPRDDWDALKERDAYDPKDPGKIFSERDNQYLKNYFGTQLIEEIRFVRGFTEIAIAWQARQLGLRKPCLYWDQRKVCLWLNLNPAQLASIGKTTGLKIHACADERGKVQVNLISTLDLARMLVHGGLFQKLLAKGADGFFIREIVESSILIKEGICEMMVIETMNEVGKKVQKQVQSPWTSHGHTSLNPMSPATFGLFFNGHDHKIKGLRYWPEDLHPAKVHKLL